MKMKQIAVALAALSVSAIANAGVTAAQIESARTAGTLDQAWISGATAPTKIVYEGWVVGCNAGTNTIFTTQATSSTSVTPGSLGNYNAYACVRGTRVSVLYHTLDGGSLNAYTPHTVNSKLARVKYVGNNQSGCSTTALAYTDSTNTKNNADVYKGCTQVGINLPATGATAASNSTNAAAVAADTLAPQKPVGGFSDVEAALFPATIGGGNVSSFGTESNAFIGQAFGVAVSIPLYRKLQEVQGITEASNAFNPELAPSLSKSQIASILADGGAVQSSGTWQPILGEDPGQKVIVQRRVDTSGTQASSNAFFLGNPCTGSGGLAPANASAGDYQVVLNSGSGNVKAGITTASTTNDTTAQYAIGVLSMENDWRAETSAANAGYRFIKVGGVHPETGDVVNARLQAATGAYPFHFEVKTFVANGVPAGFQRNIVPTIASALRNPLPAACATTPRGLTLNPDTPNSCEVGTVKAKVTNFGNNCSPAQLFE